MSCQTRYLEEQRSELVIFINRSITTENNERGSGVPLTKMNGTSSWPEAQWPNTQLLTISYELKQNFTFTISGSMMDPPKSLIVSLETGANDLDENVVCQLAAKYYENKLFISNGKIQNEEGLNDTMTAGSNFNIGFGCRDDYYMDIYTGSSFVQQLELNNSIDTIRYISVDGNVQSIDTLSYNFGDGLRGDLIYALPEWPRPQWPNDNSIVFLIPRTLQTQSGITISGSVPSNPDSLTISLVSEQSNTNYSNIACQLDTRFNENTLNLNTVVYGELQDVKNDQSITANDILSGSDFNISFTCRSGNGENVFDISSNNSYIDQVPTGHDFSDIRYIVLEGNIDLVKTLEFHL
ncbi:uncharacterized protein LOC128671257 isoform X2 [Plodia interpunctella]|uniref:uncharacterized protein LOC128671257 isoform X2 n=1 Tax=Plodia interpunctella TaxID=58824 RepID=UPI002367B2E9|nr:uncharacterized protein LOC128671257 isoform X2 [Plodia interpunctella]